VAPGAGGTLPCGRRAHAQAGPMRTPGPCASRPGHRASGSPLADGSAPPPARAPIRRRSPRGLSWCVAPNAAGDGPVAGGPVRSVCGTITAALSGAGPARGAVGRPETAWDHDPGPRVRSEASIWLHEETPRRRSFGPVGIEPGCRPSMTTTDANRGSRSAPGGGGRVALSARRYPAAPGSPPARCEDGAAMASSRQDGRAAVQE
jgi:hypothetical protein